MKLFKVLTLAISIALFGCTSQKTPLELELEALEAAKVEKIEAARAYLKEFNKIDKDQDGIQDSINQKIELEFSKVPEMQKASEQMVRGLNRMLRAAVEEPERIQFAAVSFMAGSACFFSQSQIYKVNNVEDIYRYILLESLNTEELKQAYEFAIAGLRGVEFASKADGSYCAP